MELTKVKGNTYLIKAPTNIGVYLYKNKNCLLVDTGINNSQAKRIDEVLVAAGLHPRYIFNTHSHTDHCGGNHYFQRNYPGLQVYTSELEQVYMRIPNLLAAILYSGNPLRGIESERSSTPAIVDFVLEPGTCKINDEKFGVISLPGHTPGQIGLITPERVCFLGDAIFSQETIKKYKLPFLFDIELSIRTLKQLRDVDADYFVLGHTDQVIDRGKLLELIDLNLCNLDKFQQQMLELMNQPVTRDELVEQLTILNDLEQNLMEYHIIFSVVSSLIKHLDDHDLVDYSIADGKCYYFKKPE